MKKAFTLIELLLTIAIVMIIGTFGSVFMARNLTQNNISNVSDQIMDQVKKAQLYSMMGKRNTSWGISYGSNRLTLFATGNPELNETFEVSPAISISGLNTITFSKVTGIPDTTPVITIIGNGNTKTLTVNSMGTISR